MAAIMKQNKTSVGMSPAATDIAAMTWLEAAEHILKLEGPEMHIRDLTERVMNLGMVNSHCRTSLETLLYRQSHKPQSKFKRVTGRMGWFKLTGNSGGRSGGGRGGDTSQYSFTNYEDDEIVPKSVIVHRRKRKERRREEEQEDQEEEDSDSDSSSTSSSDEDSNWSLKYHHLKAFAKRMIMANVALANDLQLLEEEIEKSQQERKYLLERLLDKQSNAKTVTNKQDHIKPPPPAAGVPTKITPASTNKTKKAPPSPVVHKPHPVSTPPTRSSEQRLIYNSISEPRDLFSTSSSSSNEEEETEKGAGGGATNKEGPSKTVKPAKDEQTGTGGRKKRIRRLQAIPLHEDGSPVFPIKLGGLQVHCLGKVVWDRPSFHNERYIWPLGFKSTRSYPSMTSPSRRCLYTCHILDGKDGPIFEMISEESPDSPIRASSATACHHIVLKAINAARDKQATNAGSGPEFFGFSHPSILNLIQMLPNAEKCTKYKPTQFQQPLSRGKASIPPPVPQQSGGSRKAMLSSTSSSSTSAAKRREKINVTQTESSVASDPSLAPVVNQLISLHEFMSSSSDSDSTSNETDQELVIDTTGT